VPANAKAPKPGKAPKPEKHGKGEKPGKGPHGEGSPGQLKKSGGEGGEGD
jgi:hypothetical protein